MPLCGTHVRGEIMARLDKAQEKLKKHALEGMEQVWVSHVKRGESYEQYVSKMADFLDMSKEDVMRAMPTKRWKEFQEHADDYKSDMIDNFKKAIEEDRWKKNLKKAFSP